MKRPSIAQESGPSTHGQSTQPRPAPLTSEQVEALRGLDGCTLANAIETFHERLRNEGFVDNSIHAVFPRLRPMVGYAATVKIRGSLPPTSNGIYPDRTDLWDYLLSLPAPRVLVAQDCSTRPGVGSLLGAVHTNIVKALGCVGAVTNGSVRDIPALENLSFPVFSGGVSVSHAYIHIVEMGAEVELGGLRIKPGDLLHGDIHGVQCIPQDIAAGVPIVAGVIMRQEREIIGLCRSAEFSLEKLRTLLAKSPP